MKELFESIRRNAVGLSLFAIVTAGVIAVAQTGTSERIKANVRAAEARALNEIVPASSYNNELLNDTLVLSEHFDTGLLGPIAEDARVYRARMGNEAVAVLLPAVAPDGYTADIGLIVGIFPDGTLAGVRVVAHRETPGLGDKVERRKSAWIDSFSGKSLTNPDSEGWAVKKDGGTFDQFTGATITPRAVVSAVHRSLEFFDQNKDDLLYLKEDISDGE